MTEPRPTLGMGPLADAHFAGYLAAMASQLTPEYLALLHSMTGEQKLRAEFNL